MAKSAVSGIKDIIVDGLNLIIETNDGNKFTMTFPKPSDGSDGVSVVNVEIDKNNHLICTMSDSSTIDAGEIKGIGGNDCDCPEIDYATKEDIDSFFG